MHIRQNAASPFSRRTGATKPNRYDRLADDLLARAGIAVNGVEPWDPQIHHDKTFQRILAQGRLGAGEAYMDGWWSCEALDEMVCRILRARILDRIDNGRMLWTTLRARLFNLQNPHRAFTIGDVHYDRGNDLFETMLDRRMVYTCAYWKNASTLDEAQEHKLDLVCRKIGLETGMRVLDIGCGWGAFARFAAERYGARVVGVTVSREQVEMGMRHCAGLPVELRLQDYRDIEETFDRVVSLGMFEHVGYKNYRTYMETVRRTLRPDGLFLLHTIGGNRSTRQVDPWIGKYIFPNSMLPSAAQISRAIEGLFVMEDWHNFGPDYDKTLMAWWRNFENGWSKLRQNYSERFHRMWRYYLLVCAAGFRARYNNLWQIVLSPHGVEGGYQRPAAPGADAKPAP